MNYRNNGKWFGYNGEQLVPDMIHPDSILTIADRATGEVPDIRARDVVWEAVAAFKVTQRYVEPHECWFVRNDAGEKHSILTEEPTPGEWLECVHMREVGDGSLVPTVPEEPAPEPEGEI